MKKALNFDFSNVLGVLITHEHKDHSKYVNNFLELGINVYMSEGTKQKIRPIMSHRVHIVCQQKQFNLKDFIILPFETEHDAEEPLRIFIAICSKSVRNSYMLQIHII